MNKLKDKRIIKEWLEENNACELGKRWFLNQKEIELSKVIKALIKEKQFEWANWTITKCMTHKQNVLYACYSAKQSLHLFEKQYPKDKRPRKAILAAMKWAKNPSDINQSAAWSAWSAAWSAVESARSAARSAAESAARSAVESARSAAESAAESAARLAARSAAESAARSAAWLAWSAAESAWSAAESAAWKKILNYGLTLMKGNKNE